MSTSHIVSYVFYIPNPYFNSNDRNVYYYPGQYPPIPLPTSTTITDYLSDTTTLNVLKNGIYPNLTTVTINLKWEPANNDITALQSAPMPSLAEVQLFNSSSCAVGGTPGAGGWAILQSWVDGVSVYQQDYYTYLLV